MLKLAVSEAESAFHIYKPSEALQRPKESNAIFSIWLNVNPNFIIKYHHIWSKKKQNDTKK